MSSTDAWVTVAKAAEVLTARGDEIDPSNVSRYLARYPVIPSERRGKFRMVDLAALIEHRRTNVFVADKQAARGTEAAASPPVVAASAPVVVQPKAEPEPLELTAPDGDSSLADINKQIKLLELRRRQREEDEADGKVIPSDEVLVLISTAMRTMVAEFERQEVNVAQKFGRDVSIEFRKVRKAAQAKAAAELIEMAKKNMPAALAAQITNQSVESDEPQEQTV
jgi:hypothetical protein